MSPISFPIYPPVHYIQDGSANNNPTISYYLDFPFNTVTKEKGAMILVNQIKKKHKNYIGFKNKKELASFLLGEIYGFNADVSSAEKKNKKPEIEKIIKKTIVDCRKISKDNSKLAIHVFPSYNKFINTKMSGASGYTSDSQNILIFISPQQNWQTALKNTLAHEFTHTEAFKYHQWQTLLDSFIFEGLADNFRELAMGGKPAPWSLALSKNTAKKLFSKMKKFLGSKDENLYSQIFFGYDRKYPMWSGYTIGYRIVGSYLKNNKDKSWPKIFKLKPAEILKQAKY